MRAYVDSDILIWHLRGESKALRFLGKLFGSDEYQPWIGALQRAEVVFFMRPGEESDTLLFLSQFKTASVNEEIVDTASRLYRRWNPSHGTGINDALLAATAMSSGGKVYTLNTKHFPMEDLLVEKAW